MNINSLDANLNKTYKWGEDIQIGNHSLKKISYADLMPGDIVCTYESTGTSPSVLEALDFQKMVLPSSQKPLHKMLHFEVIVEKCARAGMYRIAHASGLSKKVELNYENFKNYDPGQAIIVFRSKHQTSQQIELAKIQGLALQIADEVAPQDTPIALKNLSAQLSAKVSSENLDELKNLATEIAKKALEAKMPGLQQLAGQVLQRIERARTKSVESLAECIKKVAMQTAEKGLNTWQLPLTSQDSLWDKVKKFIKIKLFSWNKSPITEEKLLRRLARMAVMSGEGKDAFYKKDGITPKAMSCVNYVANVVNVSIIRSAFEQIINSKNLSAEKKIDTIVETLKATQKLDTSLPALSFKYSNSLISSANFVEFLLKNPTEWENVGYLGSACDHLDPTASCFIEKTSKEPVSTQEIENLKEILNKGIPGNLGEGQEQSIASNPSLSTEQIAAVLHHQGIIDSTGRIVFKQATSLKIDASFIYLYSLAHNLSSDITTLSLSSPGKLQTFKEAAERYKKLKSLDIDSKEIDDLLSKYKNEAPEKYEKHSKTLKEKK